MIINLLIASVLLGIKNSNNSIEEDIKELKEFINLLRGKDNE